MIISFAAKACGGELKLAPLVSLDLLLWPNESETVCRASAAIWTYLLNSACNQVPDDRCLCFLANADYPAYCLTFDGRIPLWLDDVDTCRCSEV